MIWHLTVMAWLIWKDATKKAYREWDDYRKALANIR